MTSKKNSALRRCGGFTLVEAMIAATIAVTVIGLGLAFMVEGTRASIRATSSLNNDVNQWGISSRLQLDSKLANGATIYKTATVADITAAGRRKGDERGKLLILSTSVTANGSNTARYEKISGYSYNSANRTLYRFEYKVVDGEKTNELEKIVTDHLASFVFLPVATEVDSLDPAGPFVCRDTSNTNAATAVFRLNQGRASQGTDNSILSRCRFSFATNGYSS